MICNLPVMKNLNLLVLILFFPLFSFSPFESTLKKDSGIKFQSISFEKALKLAKESGKLIFIDMHTTWCGPCKEMAATTFKDAEVGKVFNSKFINLKVDAEKDADGPSLSKIFSVRAYPTLLFINSQGELVQKVIGKQSKEKLLYIASSVKD